LSEDIIEKLDNIAKEEHKSRSMLLREAAQKLIEEHRRGIEEAIKREKIQEAVSLQDSLRKKSGKWDGVAEVRKWRERAK
jgi:metal-responsive CopG/Arc/MetJ family transcriptional regulator